MPLFDRTVPGTWMLVWSEADQWVPRWQQEIGQGLKLLSSLERPNKPRKVVIPRNLIEGVDNH